MALRRFSSSKIDREYDVFLCFRGPDTREGIVNHLHSALVAAGVSAFLDRKSLGPGEHIPSSLEKSIKASRIGIPVFSENFAQSKWCLTELSIMVSESILIFPVFYGVEPLDLRDGGKLVQRLESRKGSWSADFMEKCKEDLKHVSRLSGYCRSTFGKPDLIREVVKTVQKTLRKSPLEYLDTSRFFGFEWHVDHLQKLLKVGNHQQKVVKVGIHGMSGIGKTALASIVCKHILHEFDVLCVLWDVGQRSKTHGLAEVQQKMLRDLLEFEAQVDHVQHGKSLLQERLRGKNVLLLLDDIETPEQLEALGGCFTHFGEGSRLLITTTHTQILNVANVDEQYEVRRLLHSDALRLFISHALPNSSSPDQHLQSVCNEIVSACEGLPITLQVVAKELVGQRDESVWTSWIEKLRRHPDPQNKLKTCYDSLDGDEKEMFQDIACFFAGTEKETAAIFWEELKLSASASLERLSGKHMISLGSRNELLMHSCLRYLGRALAREIHMEPRKRTRLFGDSDPESILWGSLEKVRTRYIWYEPKEKEILNAECFKPLTQLQLLWLSNVVIGHFEDIHLRSLIWLRWARYSSQCLPPGLNLGKLAILQVTDGRITLLWDDQSQHQQILPRRLKVLDLSRCPLLESLPNTLNYNFLQTLDLQNCESLRSLPSMAGFNSLVSLNMEGCGVSSLPEDFGEVPSLRELNLSRCKNLSKLPANFGNLSNLKELRIAHNGKLTKLPESFGLLKALVYLDAGYCQLSDDGLPVGISELTMVRVINLEHNRFSRLPGLKKLIQLSELYLDGCAELVELSDLPSSLRRLSIPHCRCLTRVSALWDLRQLISLDAMMSDQLVELQGLESLHGLTSLNLMGCKNISTKSLESCLGGLRSLESLFMGGAGITAIQLQTWYGSITKAISLLDERCDIVCTPDKPSSAWRFAEAEGKKGEEKVCMEEQNEVCDCAGYIVCSVVFEDGERDSNRGSRKRLGYSIERGEKQTQMIHPEMRVEGGSGHVLELRIVRVEEDDYFEWLQRGSRLKVKGSSDYEQWKAYFGFLMHNSPSSICGKSVEETQSTKITFGM